MENNHINYLEFKASNLEKIKAFYSKAFGWKFTDFGTEYVAFTSSGLEGGFERSDDEISNGVLVVLYHDDLDLIQETVKNCGGQICVDIFSFPGGHRFHFKDPSGNELAIWSDKYG